MTLGGTTFWSTISVLRQDRIRRCSFHLSSFCTLSCRHISSHGSLQLRLFQVWSQDQFDVWAEKCVVKVGAVYVRGTYDMQGAVHVRVRNHEDVKVYDAQFQQLIPHWTAGDMEALLSTEIYCNLGKDEIADARIAADFSNGAFFAAIMYGSAPSMIRGSSASHCFPKVANILDELDESMLASLPKASSMASAAAKRAKNPKNKRAKNKRAFQNKMAQNQTKGSVRAEPQDKIHK